MSAAPEVSAARITQREFARREGCDEKVVRRAVNDGRLPRESDKLLNEALIGSGWRRQSKTRVRVAADTAPAADTSADTQAAALTLTDVRNDASAPAPPADDGEGSKPVDPVYEARRRASVKREFYAGEEAELSYKKRRGELIELETARDVLFIESRRGRDHWMNWPSRVSATMAGELGIDADRLAVVLIAYVHRHLEQLADPDGHELGPTQ